jgi:phage terminase small subunit|tara:strand:+ start:247 stop:774 length:528 start_codon:yes stop_codon:yes gene_type:complete
MPKVGEDLPKEMRLAGLKKLKPQQQEFLNNYLHKDMTQTEAARQAGYKNASVSAVRLLRNPVVAERLQEMRLEAQAKFGVSVDKSVRDLKRLRDQAWEMGKFSEAIRAEELRLKASGLLINKQHVVKEDITAASKEEIAKKLDEFKRLAESRMVNVTPDVEVIEHEAQDIAEDNQ